MLKNLIIMGMITSLIAVVPAKATTSREDAGVMAEAQEQDFLKAFGETEEIPDPYEKFNRKIFAINMVFDKAFIIPVTTIYSTIVPQWGRDRVHNFFNNLQEPVLMASAVLQLDSKKFANSCGRFLVNSILGIGGLVDIAALHGMQQDRWGMEATLAKYGGRRGVYIMLPLLGPASTRQTAAIFLNTVANPVGYIVNKKAVGPLAIGNYVNRRESFLNISNHIYNESVDPYTKMRSLYWQSHYAAKAE